MQNRQLGLVTYKKLYHISQAKMWAPKVLPYLQLVKHGLLETTTETHAHFHTYVPEIFPVSSALAYTAKRH